MWALKTLLKEARVIVGLNYSGGDLAADQDGLIEVADRDLQTGRGQDRSHGYLWADIDCGPHTV